MKMKFFTMCYALGLCCCSTTIEHGLEERDANEVTTTLQARGIDATKEPEGGKKPTYSIDVPNRSAKDAMSLLTQLKLPRPSRTTSQNASASAGILESPSAERLRQNEAREGDIEETLESLQGVTWASVQLVVPLPPRPGAAVTPSKAAVLIKSYASFAKDVQSRSQEIKSLVAAAVDGLKPDDVTLVVDSVQTEKAAEPQASSSWDGTGLKLLALGLAGALVIAMIALGFIGHILWKLKIQSPLTKHTTASPIQVSTVLQRRPA